MLQVNDQELRRLMSTEKVAELRAGPHRRTGGGPPVCVWASRW